MGYALRVIRTALWIVLVPAGFCPAGEWSIGVASVDITPPVGYRMSGYFAERVSTAVHDSLYVKALVLAQGETETALVFCDLIGVPSNVSQEARRLAGRRTGIPIANIMISATHTHTGPLYFGVMRDRLRDMAVRQHGRDPCEPLDYAAQLVEKIGAAVAQAHAALRPARLDAGIAPQEPPLSFNRRFHMKDGTVVFNPGQGNPDIVRPAGPVDRDVGIMVVRDADGGRAVACLTVIGLHADTTGGTAFSADYPYYLEKNLRAVLGSTLVSVCGIGPCGDLNDIDVTVQGRRGAERIGGLLAEMVAAAIPRLRRLDPPLLAVRSKTVAVPLQKYSPERTAQAEKDFAAGMSGAGLPFLRLVEATKILDLQRYTAATVPLEVQVFRIGGDLAIVALPGEVFTELGLAIKKASPFKTTLVIELANDAVAYVPTRKAFAEGSYETVNSRIQPGGGEMIVETAMELLSPTLRTATLGSEK